MSLESSRLPSLKDKLEKKVELSKIDEVIERVTSPKKLLKGKKK